MLITRYTKIVMALCLAAFCLLVVFDNLTDHGTHFLLLQHVLSIDTTFPGNALMYPLVHHPVPWHLAYWLIIAGEGVSGILFLVGAIRLWQLRAAPGSDFNQAKIYVIAASLLVWFFGFMVVAGEWFATGPLMMRNEQEAAFRITLVVLAVLIFVNQPDGDLAATKPKRTTEPEHAATKSRPDRPPHRRRTDGGRRRTDTE